MPTRPKLTREECIKLLEANDVHMDEENEACLLGVRGYYLQTMGDPVRNDRGIYDDAIILCSPSYYATFNANTDPSRFREGIANLNTGKWLYKLGMHGLSKPRHPSGKVNFIATTWQYQALVQAAEVTVTRDGIGYDTGWFGINIHRGGENTTSSLGCQTIVPTQWNEFIEAVKGEMAKYEQKTIAYLLINGPVR